MNFLALGHCNKEFKGLEEGISLTEQSGTLMLLMTLENPTKEDVQLIQESPIELYFDEFEGLSMFVVKFGEEYMDMPVFSKGTTESMIFEVGYGYGLSIVLANTADGKVEALRMVGLSTEMSVALNQGFCKHSNTEAYQVIPKLSKVYDKYTSEELAKACKYHFKLG